MMPTRVSRWLMPFQTRRSAERCGSNRRNLVSHRRAMPETLRKHWPEYAIEAAGLGLFMLSACAFGTLLGHPRSPLVAAVPGELARRIAMGVAMAGTAIALIYSPWGRRSGAHFNPATTLTFWRLGKVETRDAFAYVIAQVAGGLTGVLLATA